MANTLVMEQHFERDKNLKASGITVAALACLFILFSFVRWTTPVPPKPEPVIEGIEVNLGEPDNGGGSGEPQGQQGSNSNQDNTPQQSSGEQTASDNNDAEKNPDGGLPPSSKVPVKKETPVPVTPKPKAIYPKGDPNATGTKPGPGTSDKDPREGTGKGPVSGPGTGPGKPGIGIGGNGPQIISGDRKFYGKLPSYNTDVEPGSTIARIKVSANGTGTLIELIKGNLSIAYKKEVTNYLRQVKFDKADHESEITVQFFFKR